MASSQQFSLKWTNYTNHITNAFDSLRSKEDFCDVTLSCEGRKIRAHKVLLSACSSYFKDIFKENPCQHPVIIFRNVKYDDLLSIVVYMYQGEVNIEQESLPTFLHTAEMLSIQGLTDDDEKQHHKNETSASSGLTSAAAAAVAAVSAPVTVQQTIPVALHGQPIVKDTRLRSSHAKIPLAKHQPISLLSTATPGEQIMYTTVAASPVSLVQDTLPVKRKKPNKPDEYTAPVDGTSADKPIALDAIDEEQPDPDDHVAVEFFKHDVDCDLSDYGEEKTYQADDGPEAELYESESQGDEDKDAEDFDKPNIATQAELGRLFSSGGTPDASAKRPTTDAASAPVERSDPLKNLELTCRTCSRMFASLSARRRHEQSKHSENSEQFECKVCGNNFKTKWSLSTHMSRFHRSNELEFVAA